MLRLSSIVKDYKVADTKVHALKGLSLSFRKNEFVSILGPSGCGKTTLLNIIGGLDKPTSGDLAIGGVSTKKFKDKDWDVYRNSHVGFIFQSYNLIPHQTVLGNVELSLTIAGVSKAERTERAIKALDKVGLKGQYHKRPNQLSGGQSQRVAIARALVNDPEILLADEPTGALDTTTSVQIMELIKEIAKEKLVIMVTHNPELAEEYSTRIIKLLDGELQSDTNPFSKEDEIAECKKDEAKNNKDGKKVKAKMSPWTAFKLSLRNLISKKARTTMTSIAGSIGIIGVALVLSISVGTQTFIANMQDDMLSGNPIGISKTGMNISMLIQGTTQEDKVAALKEAGYINVDSMIEFLANRASFAESMMFENNITQEYVDYLKTLPSEYLAELFLNYGLDVTNNIFTDFKENASGKTENMSLAAIKNVYTAVLKKSPQSKYADVITTLTDVFIQMPQNEEYILKQYDMLYGQMAKEKGEIMIVLENDSVLTDLLLAQLGYYTQEEFLNMVFKSVPEEDGSPNKYYDLSLEKTKFSYDDLVGKKFVWYPNDDLLEEIENTDSQFHYNAYYKDSFSQGVELKITGILEPKEGKAYGSLESGFYYTDALAKHIIESNKDSNIVKALKKNGHESTSSGEQTSGGLMDGIASTADGIEQLADGTSQLNDGLSQLAEGAEQLKEGASHLTELQSGSKQLSDGSKSLSDAIVLYVENVDKMVDMFGAVINGSKQMSDGLDQLAEGAKQLKDGAENLTELQSGSKDLNEGTKEFSKAIVVYTNSVDQMIGMLSTIFSTLQTAVKENPQLLLDPNIVKLIEFLDGSNGSGDLAQISAASKQLRETATQLAEGTGGLNDGISGLTKLQEGIAGLADGIEKLQDGSKGLQSGGGNSSDLAKIKDASKQLREAAKQLADGTGGLNEGISGLTKLQEGISGLAAGMSELQTGSDGLSKGMNALNDGLADYRTDDGDGEKDAPPIGITFKYSYSYLGEKFKDVTGYLGNQTQFMAMAGGMLSGNPQFEQMAKLKSITLQQLGGIDFPESIDVFPVDFELKDFVLENLNRWNSNENLTFYSESQGKDITLTADQREDIIFTDTLSLIVAMINNLIDIITFALIGFTSLALVVSCVMIGIITYVSVVERVKEIGVIRSLGGRKRDVSNLFTAETFILGLTSGLLGIGVTYLGSFIINLIIWNLQGIRTIAIFPWYYALLMVGISILLTLVSGLMPSRSAAKKDPVEALRSE